jgi:hypothetical protein
MEVWLEWAAMMSGSFVGAGRTNRAWALLDKAGCSQCLLPRRKPGQK